MAHKRFKATTEGQDPAYEGMVVPNDAKRFKRRIDDVFLVMLPVVEKVPIEKSGEEALTNRRRAARPFFFSPAIALFALHDLARRATLVTRHGFLGAV